MKREICQICSNDIEPYCDYIYDDRYGYPKNYSLLKCKSCGHVVVAPKMTHNEIATLYTEYYPRNEMPAEMNTKSIFASKYKIYLEGKKTLCHYSIPSKSCCLDIGCGFGESLLYLKHKKCDVYGVEADENVLKMAEKYDLDVKIGLFEPADYSDQKFDYVTMSQVLEHMLNPIETVKGIHDILKPGGQLIFSVPNSQSLMAKLFKRKWINWHIPYHQQHFTKDSILVLAHKCGFEVESIKIITPTSWIIYQINHLLYYPSQGKVSVFWSYSYNNNLCSKLILTTTGIIDRLKLMAPIARLLDLFKLGESYVVMFRKQ
ncbi:class I SAM-dependent methyltransferase [Methanolobus vulcani]|uniref:Class I SAM-dependent methyltransferase n=1 Tax=Methanolobus vulcani TaxID=38026 RepID=A0A7Z8KLW4_9EURY|nr:class I SAM-dependent methyltransferase [Methanolobus vulcani]TQD23858.1 class I SAM-dependent methyltransferase [Methanolobus vulcani]